MNNSQMFAALVRITETAGETDVDARTIGLEEEYDEGFVDDVEDRLGIDPTEVEENEGPFMEVVSMMRDDMVPDEAIEDRLITSLLTLQEDNGKNFVVLPYESADWLDEFLDGFDSDVEDLEEHKDVLAEALEL